MDIEKFSNDYKLVLLTCTLFMGMTLNYQKRIKTIKIIAVKVYVTCFHYTYVIFVI